MYWSKGPLPPLETEIIDGLPYLRPRQLPLAYQSQAIEATAYALMVYLRENWLEESIPIMKWLQTQRFHRGAFDGPRVCYVMYR